MTQVTPAGDTRPSAVRANRAVYWLSRRWALLLAVLLALFNGLPWLAPLFMEAGWVGAGKAIYVVYSSLCHQLPQRSFFLFGENWMIPLDVVQNVWENSDNPLVLRQFNGTGELGWKVAWSDRMVYMYGSVLVFAIAFWPLRDRLRPLSWKGLLLFLLPMAVDGTSHVVGELFAGLEGGFRYNNAWLVALTANAFPRSFYAGDGLGSFNSWARMVTGVLFGMGVVWFLYPHLYRGFAETTAQIEAKFEITDRSP